MVRSDMPETRTRSNSISAAWSFLWRGSSSKQQHQQQQQQQQQQQHHQSSQGIKTKHHTIREEDDDEDRALGKGITRKVLPQQRRSMSSVHSSPAGSSGTSPRMDPKRASTGSHPLSHPQQQQPPSALERIAIHNSNINNALASTMHHSMSLPPKNIIKGKRDTGFLDETMTSSPAMIPKHSAHDSSSKKSNEKTIIIITITINTNRHTIRMDRDMDVN
ncbi:hypothetical protein BG011_006555 [Mortierella polycephala]|uniref:Uncharacterized protein n=1 Tax=Mortierella polycephala TaxID=41804 RepID=A0A9P6QC49_9FUNG|nr:hypothetical protein BG011_006555 [Mortierella polycephala]